MLGGAAYEVRAARQRHYEWYMEQRRAYAARIAANPPPPVKPTLQEWPYRCQWCPDWGYCTQGAHGIEYRRLRFSTP